MAKLDYNGGNDYKDVFTSGAKKECGQTPSGGSYSTPTKKRGKGRVGGGGPGAGCLYRLLQAFGVLLCISAVFWVVVMVTGKFTAKPYTVVADAERSADQYAAYLLDLDNQNIYWTIDYTRQKSHFLSALLGEKSKCRMLYCNDGTTAYTTFTFDGADFGTGLDDGQFTLTTLDGKPILADDYKRIIYHEGSQMYDTYVPVLKELSHDAILRGVIAQTEGGEHGMAEDERPLEILQGEQAVIFGYMHPQKPLELIDKRFEATVYLTEEKEMEMYEFYYRNLDVDWNGEDYKIAK